MAWKRIWGSPSCFPMRAFKLWYWLQGDNKCPLWPPWKAVFGVLFQKGQAISQNVAVGGLATVCLVGVLFHNGKFINICFYARLSKTPTKAGVAKSRCVMCGTPNMYFRNNASHTSAANPTQGMTHVDPPPAENRGRIFFVCQQMRPLVVIHQSMSQGSGVWDDIWNLSAK